MTTTDEIRRRVEEADTARSEKRAAAAQQVGELAQHRATIVEQLEDIERQLGDVLAAARDVIDIDELARFTDLPAADLTQWSEARKTARSKRKRPATGTPGAKRDTGRTPSTTNTPTTGKSSPQPESAVPRTDTVDTSARVGAAT